MLRQTATHPHLTSAEIVTERWHYGAIPGNARTFLIFSREDTVKVITARFDQAERVIAEYRRQNFSLNAAHIATRDKGNMSVMHVLFPRPRYRFPVVTSRG